MNETDSTVLQGAQIGYTITVLLTSVAAASVLVDITYIIVCFKALKKTFYHLTILALFFSDIICGVSSALFSLGPVIKHKQVGSCLLQIFVVTFGMQSNYCLIFLLSLQRYLVVRSFNFGTSQKFDKNKFVYIGGALFIVFILSICGSILSSRAEFMQVCGAAVVYGDSFYIFVIITTIPVILIIILLLIMSLITSFRLLKKHSNGKISPISVTKEDLHNNDHVPSSISTTSKRFETSQTHNCMKDSYCKNNKTIDMKVQFEHSEDSNCGNKVSINITDCVHKENLKKGIIDLKSNTNICSTSNDASNSIDINIEKLKKSWEIKAFLTTIIIAFQTVILTGPFVASFWVEVLSISPVTMQTRLLLSVPFLINSFLNPFIYAWRIPEIRQEFSKLFRLKKNHR